MRTEKRTWDVGEIILPEAEPDEEMVQMYLSKLEEQSPDAWEEEIEIDQSGRLIKGLELVIAYLRLDQSSILVTVLIDDAITPEEYIPTNLIECHPKNASIYGDQEDLDELVDSLSRHGCRDALIVVPVEQSFFREQGEGAKYFALHGNRRLMASRIAGLEQLPCKILAYANQEDELENLLLGNRYRIKNKYTIIKECQLREEIAQSRSRQRRGRKGQGGVHSRAIAVQDAGISESTYMEGKAVLEYIEKLATFAPDSPEGKLCKTLEKELKSPNGRIHKAYKMLPKPIDKYKLYQRVICTHGEHKGRQGMVMVVLNQEVVCVHFDDTPVNEQHKIPIICLEPLADGAKQEKKPARDKTDTGLENVLEALKNLSPDQLFNLFSTLDRHLSDEQLTSAWNGLSNIEVAA